MTEFVGYGLIALIVAALIFYAVVALLPAGLTVAPIRDDIPDELPRDRLVTRDDLIAVRLPVVLRGYRMADTDDLLDRLTLEIAVRDRELDQLRQALAESRSQAAEPSEAAAPADDPHPGVRRADRVQSDGSQAESQ